MIDLTLFGILQGNAKTNWIMVPIVGLVYFAVYFFLFRFLIRWRNYVTPGREDDAEETKLYTRADYNRKKEQSAEGDRDDRPAAILASLGGEGNILNLDCCATRLRITVGDSTLVSQTGLKTTGAAGVIVKGNGVQVIYGPQVSVIKSEVEELLRRIRES